jgi:hypothetical protein
MTSVNTTRVVRFLGLSDLATADGDAPSFPLGLLYPYSRDLQRVCACYDALCRACPEAASMLVGDGPGVLAALSLEQAQAVTSYLSSIATLHGRIAFAPGRGGESVGAAYRLTRDAIVHNTRRQARQRRAEPA